MPTSKGVLLCSRPQPSSHLQAKRNAIRARSFHPSFTQEIIHPCGRNPAIADRKRFIPPTPHVNHWDIRLYLAQLVQKKRALILAVEEARVRSEARMAKQCAESRLLQELVRSGAGGVDGLSWKEAKVVAAAIVSGQELPSVTEKDLPAWARSEERQQALEDAECCEITAFAQNLDADSYLNELENNSETILALNRLVTVEEELNDFEKLVDKEDKPDSPAALPLPATLLLQGAPPLTLTDSLFPPFALGSVEDEDNPFRKKGVWRQLETVKEKEGGKEEEEEEGGEDVRETVGGCSAMVLVDQALASDEALRHFHSKKSLMKVVAALMAEKLHGEEAKLDIGRT